MVIYCRNLVAKSVYMYVWLQIGHCVLKRENHYHLSEASVPPLMPLHCQMPVLEALMTCVKMGWMAILVSTYTCMQLISCMGVDCLMLHYLLYDIM